MAPIRSLATGIAAFSHSQYNVNYLVSRPSSPAFLRRTCQVSPPFPPVSSTGILSKNSALQMYPSTSQHRCYTSNHHSQNPISSRNPFKHSSSPPSNRNNNSDNSSPQQTRTKKTALLSALPPTSSFTLESTLYMTLLAIQFGLQPILTRTFTPKSINRSTIVLSQDIVKFIMAGLVLLLTGEWKAATTGWTIHTWLTVAGVPATLYCIQNLATLIAYQNLQPLTFNVLNQTKTLSAALCCFLIMGKVQSKIQIVSLLILFLSACIIEKIFPLPFISDRNKQNEEEKEEVLEEEDTSSTKEVKGSSSNSSSNNHTQGVIAVLLASFISGLAGALTQRSLQSVSSSTASSTGKVIVGRNSYFFTMELCVASILVMIGSLFKSEDGKRIQSNGFFHGWTPRTIIPILTNAAGGIVVGLVTKYAGAVKKGFALIFGLLLSGILQAMMKNGNEQDGSEGNGSVTKEQIVGGSLAALSLWMYSAYPAK